MGHLVTKDTYRALGAKIDNLSMRSPWNKTLHAILKEFYTEEEADVVVKMPYKLTRIDRIAKVTGYDKTKLQNILNDLCLKGLVIDLMPDGERFYMPSPMVLGIFEFTMMRTDNGYDPKKSAKLFHDYMTSDDSFYKVNSSYGGNVSILRVLPYEDQVRSDQYIEVLDYEKAAQIIENTDKFAIGICSCRHEKHHVGEKTCDTPLEVCASLGVGAEFTIRNKLGRECSKSEMLELSARVQEQGIVCSADNVQKGAQYMCHCCGCCCNYLAGIGRWGIANTVVTSNFIARIDEDNCVGCGKCAKVCPIDAIEMLPIETPGSKKKKKKPEINLEFCLGCGVCASKCVKDAMQLVKREQRVLTPETTFHKILLQSLERETLQNLIFDNPQSITQDFMRGLVGGFLRLDPVKKALMSDTLRSRFLKGMETVTKVQGMEWVAKM